MIRRMLTVLIAIACCQAIGGVAWGQNTVRVLTVQDRSLNSTGGLVMSGVSCTAAAGVREAGWIQVDTMEKAVFLVNYVDAGASAASLNIACETSNSNTTVFGSGYSLPVLQSTATTGITTMNKNTLSWVSTNPALTNPGTSNFTFTVSNIPLAYIACLFTCGAGAVAGDTITVRVQGGTP